MNITLYSTGCPKCSVLKMQLDRAGIEYQVSDNIDDLIERNIMSVPVLVVDEEWMDFSKAIGWIRSQERGK